jgi:hypothetical protein
LPFFANGKHHTNLPFSLVLEHQMLSPNYSDLTRFR